MSAILRAPRALRQGQLPDPATRQADRPDSLYDRVRALVTGWDDTDAAAPTGLTTLRQSLRDQGRRCARIALGHSLPDGQEPPGWEVVERTSTR